MRRGWIYLVVVLAAGIATASWFVATQEVDPAATEPGAYELFLVVYTAAATVSALVLCLAAEIVLRLVRKFGRTSA